jgi:excisionase family DNA binding protein
MSDKNALTVALDTDAILTVLEVAQVLRCSKGHASKLINGKILGTTPLPAIRLGRRIVVRSSSLNTWLSSNEV